MRSSKSHIYNFTNIISHQSDETLKGQQSKYPKIVEVLDRIFLLDWKAKNSLSRNTGNSCKQWRLCEIQAFFSNYSPGYTLRSFTIWAHLFITSSPACVQQVNINWFVLSQNTSFKNDYFCKQSYQCISVCIYVYVYFLLMYIHICMYIHV